jgi:hypothetical protein
MTSKASASRSTKTGSEMPRRSRLRSALARTLAVASARDSAVSAPAAAQRQRLYGSASEHSRPGSQQRDVLCAETDVDGCKRDDGDGDCYVGGDSGTEGQKVLAGYEGAVTALRDRLDRSRAGLDLSAKGKNRGHGGQGNEGEEHVE